MNKSFRVKGRLEPKSNILSHPDLYQDVTLLCFVVTEAYRGPLTAYYKENGIMNYQELQLAPWPLNPTERSRKLFFALRDRLAIHTEGEGTGREYKDHLYRSCVKELDIRKEGKIVNSIKDLDKRETWLLIELMVQWCLEAESDIRDLIPEYNESQGELKK